MGVPSRATTLTLIVHRLGWFVLAAAYVSSMALILFGESQ
jgi:hypothetical protein